MIRLIDLHTHTIFSDGELIPSELVRRAVIHGYKAIALTDHADYTNLEQLIEAGKKAKYLENEWDIRVLVGVELTHVPPRKIATLAKKAKELAKELDPIKSYLSTMPIDLCLFVDKPKYIVTALLLGADPGPKSERKSFSYVALL